MFRTLERGDSALATTVRGLLSDARETCRAVERGELTPADAAAAIIETINRERFFPGYLPHGNPEMKYVDVGQDTAMEFLRWSRTDAPHDDADGSFDEPARRPRRRLHPHGARAHR
ncbi:Uncharacterised protein [Mycobacteroides abscessus subsp. abscessus]|nr:Uncharacterised protein [Mycobacteroides abscessus subsp. abscessus]